VRVTVGDHRPGFGGLTLTDPSARAPELSANARIALGSPRGRQDATVAVNRQDATVAVNRQDPTGRTDAMESHDAMHAGRPRTPQGPPDSVLHSGRSSVLETALTKTTGWCNEVLLLHLTKDANRLEADGARSLVRCVGQQIEAQHQQRLQQLEKAIEAAQSKGWWQSFLNIFKYVSIAASACAGTVGLVAAGLMLIGTLLERRFPKIALALQSAAAAITLAGAATGLRSALKGAAKAQSAAAGTMGVIGQGTAAGASGGIAVGHAMTAVRSAAEDRATANQLLLQHFIERRRSEQLEQLEHLKELGDFDARASREFLSVIERGADVAAAAVKA
jgi:hypothetical protein